MSPDPGEQQELDETASGEQPATLQERVLNLYNSQHLVSIAIGFWLKLTAEALIVALGLIPLFLLPAVVAIRFAIVPLSYPEAVLSWLSFTVTVELATWCFTEQAIGGEPSESDDLQD